ncbi:TlpA family protein disulfide reductase [Mycolicibacterium mengxianglii]|uniref:TlpA family protein disulfide reductase n=1 Tax=Mycolicibacterium mengxianglii TaxID=2736649 RepID=UPI0018D03FEA|nr:thioredoxin family protein [Mycolicibacterium mengxianglii]
MTPLLYTAIAIATALGAAGLLGWLLTRRSGVLRSSGAEPDNAEPDNAEPDSAEINIADLGLSRTGPTVAHFSAVWCGPCAGVRRVVDQVCDELAREGATVAHVEIDMDANPGAARRLSVLSLPTTFIFDAQGRQRYRSAGVPKAADLRSALSALLA